MAYLKIISLGFILTIKTHQWFVTTIPKWVMRERQLNKDEIGRDNNRQCLIMDWIIGKEMKH